MSTLITFLGRGRHDDNTGYRRARYRFPEAGLRESPFFGIELARQLQPARVVILGTPGSMWSVLIEHLVQPNNPSLEAERLALLDAETNQRVTMEQLAPVTEFVREAAGMDAELRLIPGARESDEQIRILQEIAETISGGRLHLDLTHGFRHLGMLGFLSAYFLEALRSVRVDGLWYAALDMTPSEGPQEGETPVLRLDGLDAVHRWIEALARFDSSGDYGVFAPLLERDGLPEDKANCLVEANFLETTLNLAGARQRLRTVLQELESNPLTGASGLFQGKLIDRLAWARSNDLGDNQRKLALRALGRRDYPRAAIFGFEAFLTRLCNDEGEDPSDHASRERVRDGFAQTLDREPEWKRDAWHLLRQLRNAMAHGTPPRHPRMREIIRNRQRLHRELEAAIQRLNNT
ncbi:CRISPR-associated Csx2 family protein [Thioalkalivibrio sp. ALE21]|uniref:TIGR02221 family CRISPR-associated protein n=1 Tax=Thioalkalivibrio sp. ALE21 TaxID=1158175 RepID=UPI000D95D22A|nr:TIGR02221 family CRISPR-associated protein [Thioalkalivibrio sp. ALE21]PYF99972.1 CRISPR-associated Csx2 family protein [Thioalkalivibrio sp. ALE21]